MKKRESDSSLEQIVEFADLAEFLDTPIKRYSSGMRMRLGFSVAAHLSTDVLFVRCWPWETHPSRRSAWGRCAN